MKSSPREETNSFLGSINLGRTFEDIQASLKGFGVELEGQRESISGLLNVSYRESQQNRVEQKLVRRLVMGVIGESAREEGSIVNQVQEEWELEESVGA